jgi:hypothetical protein
MDEPGHLRSQLAHLRQYLELLFQVSPKKQLSPKRPPHERAPSAR